MNYQFKKKNKIWLIYSDVNTLNYIKILYSKTQKCNEITSIKFVSFKDNKKRSSQ